MKIAQSWNQTLPCPECGKWGARWTSQLAGHTIIPEHTGDVVIWCKECTTISNVMISEWNPEVRMSPDEVDWADRREYWHVSSAGWDTRCPSDAYVHVGRREVSEWLWRARLDTSDEIPDPVLYRLRVTGQMPKRLVKDKGAGWLDRRVAYVQSYEVPGSVCLYLPKGDLEIVERIEL